jgi:hypothetical protein
MQCVRGVRPVLADLAPSVPRLAPTFPDAIDGPEIAHASLREQNGGDHSHVRSDEDAQDDIAQHRSTPSCRSVPVKGDQKVSAEARAA